MPVNSILTGTKPSGELNNAPEVLFVQVIHSGEKFPPEV